MLGTISTAASLYLQSRENAPRYTGAAQGTSVMMNLRVARANARPGAFGPTCKTESRWEGLTITQARSI